MSYLPEGRQAVRAPVDDESLALVRRAFFLCGAVRLSERSMGFGCGLNLAEFSALRRPVSAVHGCK
jgi:hypothetical protein